MTSSIAFDSDLDIEAEQSVIASILSDSDVIYELQDYLSPEDFNTPSCRLLYRTALEAARLDHGTDPVSLVAILERNKKLSGSPAEAIKKMHELQSSAATSAGILTHAEIIKDRSRLRKVARASHEIADLLSKPGVSGEEAVSSAESIVFNLNADSQRDAESCISLAESASKFLEELKTRKPGEMIGIPTGFAALDKATLGWNPGDVVVVAARPGIGKTSFATQLSLNLAKNTGLPVAILSYEMSREELTAKFLAVLLGKPLSALRTGQLTQSEERRIREAIAEADRLNIIINDDPPTTKEELESWLKRTQRKTPLGGIVLDFLQMMDDSAGKTRARGLEEICYMIKRNAKRGKYPAFILSQLNRGIANRVDKRPMNSDLRESGGIEQAANTIMFLHREEVEASSDPNQAEIIITKQRLHTPNVSVLLRWDGPSNSFTDDRANLLPIPLRDRVQQLNSPSGAGSQSGSGSYY